MSTSIFIRSYRGDFEWLTYCVRSIHKFVSGFDSIVLVIPDKDANYLPNEVGARVDKLHFTVEQTHGYVDQQITKIRAHHYTQSDRILFVDSDCVFFQPCTVEDYTCEGKPLLLKTPYDVFRALQNETGRIQDVLNWQPITEGFVGFPVDHEYMRRLPMMHTSHALAEIERRYPDMITRVLRLKNNAFSEFNVIGAVVEKYLPESYHIQSTEGIPLPTKYCEQYWSWGGMSRELRESLECTCG